MKSEQDRIRHLVPRVLGRALELLSDRKRWTKGTLARTGEGAHTNAISPEAEQWCAVGAIEKCAYEVLAESGIGGIYCSSLSQMAQAEARPHIVGAGARLRGEVFRDGQVEIPTINDKATNGGYPAVLQGLAAAVGVALTLSAEQQRQIDRSTARSQVARKGWATRRRKWDEVWAKRNADYAERLAAQQAQQSPPDQPTMTFGGALPTTDATDDSTQRKDSPICATGIV